MADKFLKSINGALVEAGADHGNLLGLGDDDHTQYLHLSGRGAARQTVSGPVGFSIPGDTLQLLSGNNDQYTSIALGRASAEGYFGIVGIAGQFFGSSNPGDIVLRVDGASGKFYLGNLNSVVPEMVMSAGLVSFAGQIQNSGPIRAIGDSPSFTTLKGIELAYSQAGNFGYLASMDRPSTFTELRLYGSAVYLNPNGEGRVGIQLPDNSFGSTVYPSLAIGCADGATGLAIGQWGIGGKPRMAINTGDSGWWSAYDYYGDQWNLGIVQRGGFVGVGTSAFPKSRLHANGWLTLGQRLGFTAIASNLWYDEGPAAWKYLANGYGTLITPENNGEIRFFSSPENTSGADAIVSQLTLRMAIKNDGQVEIGAPLTLTPASATAPIILGANGQGQLVTGLNADQLDGNHSSAFALSGHNHDSSYLGKTAQAADSDKLDGHHWSEVPAPDIGEGHILLAFFNYNAFDVGSWNPQVEANYWFGGNIYNSNHSDGDQISWKAYLAAGTYTMRVVYGKQLNQGITDFYIDTTEVGSVDTYAASGAANNIYTVTGISVSTSGLKTIKAKVDGKNISSTDHYTKITSIALWRTA